MVAQFGAVSFMSGAGGEDGMRADYNARLRHTRYFACPAFFSLRWRGWPTLCCAAC